jgi:sarcosine oxidase
MASDFDIIVIGVGAMGSAACYHLARRGVRVLGLERFDIPNTMGSSHGLSRMIRSAYYEHVDYVPLLRRSFELWDELETASGRKLLYRTGGLYIGRSDDPFIVGSLRSAQAHRLPHEMLDHAHLGERYPQFHMPADRVALFEREAGLLVPEECILAHVEQARRHGADVRSHESVLEWREHANEITVRTNMAEYRARAVVFTAGPWSDRLVRDLGVPLVVTRQVLGWVQPLQPELFQLGRLPVWAIGHDDGSLHYGFPMLPDDAGFKIADHHPGPPADPETVDRTPRPEDEQDFRPTLREFLPLANGPLKSMRICLYTNSPDGHFIIDRHPGHRNVSLACGFSGHGFKFASVVGEILADVATRGTTTLPARFLSLRRFAATT